MRRRSITQGDIKRWKDQGLGQGELAAYKPWIDVRSFSSRGRVSRAFGITAGREHHLLSDTEYKFWLIADYAKGVIDIREQFPLFPEEHTQHIAAYLGIRHPRYPNSKTMLVMTTDFLLTLTDEQGKRTFLAVSIKSAKDLHGPHRARTLAKLEIERRYWLMRNVPWQLMTNEDFDSTVIANLDWLSYVSVANSIASQSLIELIPKFLSSFQVISTERLALGHLIEACARSLGGISDEFAYQLFRYCAWHHLIELDISVPIGPMHIPKTQAIAVPARQHRYQGGSRGNERHA